MVRRIIFSIAAASGIVLLIAALSPTDAAAGEITFQAPAAKFRHISNCKSGPPPCDKFSVVSQFFVTDDFDLDNDLHLQEIALFFGLGTMCDSMNLSPLFETHVLAGAMSKKATAASVKYSFKGMTQAFDYQTFGLITTDLNLTITINNKGKGLLKASGTGNFAGITSSPFVFGLFPFMEPDADNDPNINNGDFNCGVATATIKNQ